MILKYSLDLVKPMKPIKPEFNIDFVSSSFSFLHQPLQQTNYTPNNFRNTDIDEDQNFHNDDYEPKKVKRIKNSKPVKKVKKHKIVNDENDIIQNDAIENDAIIQNAPNERTEYLEKMTQLLEDEFSLLSTEDQKECSKPSEKNIDYKYETFKLWGRNQNINGDNLKNIALFRHCEVMNLNGFVKINDTVIPFLSLSQCNEEGNFIEQPAPNHKSCPECKLYIHEDVMSNHMDEHYHETVSKNSREWFNNEWLNETVNINDTKKDSQIYTCSLCNVKINVNFLINHKCHHMAINENGKFKCMTCNLIFPNEHEWNEHMNMKRSFIIFEEKPTTEDILPLLMDGNLMEELTTLFENSICPICNETIEKIWINDEWSTDTVNYNGQVIHSKCYGALITSHEF